MLAGNFFVIHSLSVSGCVLVNRLVWITQAIDFVAVFFMGFVVFDHASDRVEFCSSKRIRSLVFGF